jgi:pimeloyl-ACP methyl ester carboxylesterase
MKTLILDDGEHLHVSVRGSGPPVVLLHEWASSHAVWAPIAVELAHRHTVYAWDARGHGGRPLLGREPPTVGRMARDLRALCAHFGLERPALVGHSMGALTLWQAIADFGCAEIGRLVFIDQSPKLMTDAQWHLGIYGDWSAARNQAFMADLRSDFAETVLRLVAEGHNGRARSQYQANSRGIQRLREALAQLDPEPLITVWDSLGRADYRPVLPGIRVPTLLVYGGASNYYGIETARYVEQAIPGAQLHLFEGADHSPQHADRGRFLAVLGRFLEGG